jgi:hypothetical protein
MAYDDDNERTERVMFGVPYKATAAEARRVWAEVVEAPAWHDFNWRDDFIKSHGAATVSTAMLSQFAVESARAYRQCVRNAINAIEAMEADRS